MHLRKFLTRPLPPLAALSVSGVLVFLALAILLSLAERSRSAAHFLRSDTLELFVEEASGMRSEEPLSLLFTEIPRLRLPPDVLPFLQGNTVRSILSINHHRQRVEFHRLQPGLLAFANARKIAEKFSPRAAIRGVYFVWSDSDLGDVLRIPSEGGTLARDVHFRSMRRTLSPAAPFFLYMRISPAGQFPLPLPLLLEGIVKDAERIGVAAETTEGQFVLSVSLPSRGSPETSFSPFPLSSLPASREEPLLFAATGKDSTSESDALLSLLSDGQEEQKLLLGGVRDAFLERTFGTGVMGQLSPLLPQIPYTFLLRSGSGETMHWLLALQKNEQSEAVLPIFEDAFAAELRSAVVRERLLPGDISMKDVLLNPDLLVREETFYRGFPIRMLQERASEREFASATRYGYLLFSNDGEFMKDALEGEMQTSTVTHALTVDRRSLETLQKLLLPESVFFSSLRAFPGMRSFSWYRASTGGFIRHVFLLKP